MHNTTNEGDCRLSDKFNVQKQKTDLCDDKPYVIALGMFDGVHLGHRKLLSDALLLAEKYCAEAVMLTFDRHPAEILLPEKAPLLLTDTREKAILVSECGIDNIVFLHFDCELADLSPEEFIEKYILSANVKGVVCGFNYSFGKNAEGNCRLLKEYLEQRGVEVIIEEPIAINGVTVSSTYIRGLVANSDMEFAAEFLSGEYCVGGVVSHGYERGRTLGFPTANIIPIKEKLLPTPGVYATKTYIDGVCYKSVTNVGSNPTYKNTEKTVETFIDGLNGDIYGKYIFVRFYKKLRGETAFSSPDELKKQIDKDRNNAFSYLRMK